MKRLLTILILLAATLPLSAQLYNPGERLDYRVAYKAMLVPNTEMATVTVQTTLDTLQGKPVYRVMGLGKIMPEYRWFFNLEDRYDIFVDTLSLRTKRFESNIHEGDYMALYGSQLFSTSKDIKVLLRALAEKVRDDGKEYITIYYGADVKEKHAQKAADLFQEMCPNADVNLLSGGQPVYYYLISAE